MNWKSLFGMTRVMFAVWFALGVVLLRADDTFNGCTFYSRMHIGGGGGTSGQVVDVGFLPQGITAFEGKYRLVNVTGSQTLFCSRNAANTTAPIYTFFAVTGGKPRFDYNNAQSAINYTAVAEKDCLVRIEQSGTVMRAEYFESDTLKSSTTINCANFDSPYRLFLFSSYVYNNGKYDTIDNAATFDFYYLKSYCGPISDGKLQHHYVPCKTAAGVVAIADLIGEKVYTNRAAVSQFTVEEADRMSNPYIGADKPGLNDIQVELTAEGSLKVSGTVVNHSGTVNLSLANSKVGEIQRGLGEFSAGQKFETVFDSTSGLLPQLFYTLTITVTDGGRKTVYVHPCGVGFGKSLISHYDYSFTASLSSATKSIVGATYTDFPVLVRLPAEASAKLRAANGHDLMVMDEKGAVLSWEMESFNPAGESLLWVKVPSLTQNTVLTIGVGGEENRMNDPSAVWSGYVGVWHFAASEAGSKTFHDSTGHALDANSMATMTLDDGPAGMGKIATVAEKVSAPNYEVNGDVRGTFTASGWFKLPDAFTDTNESIARKKGESWSAGNGWFIEIPNGGTKIRLILGGTAYETTISDARSNWHFFQVVSTGSAVKLYVDGSATSISQTYKVIANVDPYLLHSVHGRSDEFRITKSVLNEAAARLEYRTMSTSAFFTYSALTATDPDVPRFTVPEVTAFGGSAFRICATATNTMPATGSVKVIHDGKIYAMTTSDSTVPATYVTTVSPVESETTTDYILRAESATGSVRTYETSGIYNGELELTTLRDAQEKGLSNGIFRVTRKDCAFPLTVNIAVAGTSTAVPGTDYRPFPPTATIPAGTNSVDIAVTPMTNLKRTDDATIDLDLSAGPYRISPSQGSSQMKIINYTVPAGENVWCTSIPGKASDPANWTSGVAPQAGDTVIFDGNVSSADCEWDVDATPTVANWKQLANYRGTVTVDTVFEGQGEFDKLTVSKDMQVLGGRLTHRAHTAEHPVDFYRLRVDIGGDLKIGADAVITADGLGSYGVRTEGASVYGGSNDGVGAWGSLTEPVAVGASADHCENACLGGGAIWLEVAGTVRNSGRIEADGITAVGTDTITYAGSGGSVYLKCAILSGTGTVSARSEFDRQTTNARTASGGRISLVQTDDEITPAVAARLDASAGFAVLNYHAGSGTVLVRSPGKPNGVLYVSDSSTKYGDSGYHISSFTNRLTDIPEGQTWKLDGIVFGDNGYLCVPTGTKLELVNGLASVSSRSTDGSCGLVLNGGELVLPAGTQRLSGRWTFNPRVEYTIADSLLVRSGANLGAIEMYENTDNADTLPEYGKCLLNVEGDLEVENGATIAARGCGLKKSVTTLSTGVLGALPQGHTHGGRVRYLKNNYAQYPLYAAYDSVFAPALPGNAVPFPNNTGSAEASGGVIKLTIGGRLTMNGRADVSGSPSEFQSLPGNAGGSGGSIDITAASLSGSGSFVADGGVRTGLCGGGGRIAIKLTAPDSSFTNFTGTVVASGRAHASVSDKNRWSSAGSVFLRSGEDVAGGGLLRIAMSADNRIIGNSSSTEIVPLGLGGNTAAEFKGLGLDIRDYGYAQSNTDLEMSYLKLADTNCQLDLAGRKVEVHRAWIGGEKVPIGTYRANAKPFGSALVDSVGGGSLYVSGYGIWVFVQ